jgi:anti-anti-sigma factor
MPRAASERFTGRVSPSLRCEVTTHGRWILLALAGELDLAHADAARIALLELVPTPRAPLALDLREVVFMDTTGVRLVLQAMHHADRCGADFALIRGPAVVQRVLELVGLADQLRIVEQPRLLDRRP